MDWKICFCQIWRDGNQSSLTNFGWGERKKAQSEWFDDQMMMLWKWRWYRFWFTSNADWVRPPQTANHQRRRAIHPQRPRTALFQTVKRTQRDPYQQRAPLNLTYHQHHRHLLLARPHLLPPRQLPHRIYFTPSRQQLIAHTLTVTQADYSRQ